MRSRNANRLAVVLVGAAAVGGVIVTGAFNGTGEAGLDPVGMRQDIVRALVAQQRIAVPASPPPGFIVAVAPVAVSSGPTRPRVPIVTFNSVDEPTVVVCGAPDATCDAAVTFGRRLRRETVDGRRVTIGLFVPSIEDPTALRGPSAATERFWRETPLTTELPSYLAP